MQQALEWLLWPPPPPRKESERTTTTTTTALRAWRTVSRYLSTLDTTTLNADDKDDDTQCTVIRQGQQRKSAVFGSSNNNNNTNNNMSVRDIVEAHSDSDIRGKDWPQTLVTALCSAMELQSSYNDDDDDAMKMRKNVWKRQWSPPRRMRNC
jgi:hypothetical protein